MIINDQQKGAEMKLSDRLQAEALSAIKSGDVQGDFVLPSNDGRLAALVSTSADGMFPLHNITHEGITYYVGIPKTEADM